MASAYLYNARMLDHKSRPAGSLQRKGNISPMLHVTSVDRAMVRCSKMDFSETDHGAGEGGPRCGKLAKKRKNWILASKCSVEEHICAHMGCGVRIGRPKSSFLK